MLVSPNMFMPYRNFLTNHSKGVLLLWALFVICNSWLALSYCLVSSLQPCGHLLGKGSSLGTLMCDVSLCFVNFPYGVLGQAWYLIVSMPDLCLLHHFQNQVCKKRRLCWTIKMQRLALPLLVTSVLWFSASISSQATIRRVFLSKHLISGHYQLGETPFW